MRFGYSNGVMGFLVEYSMQDLLWVEVMGWLYDDGY